MTKRKVGQAVSLYGELLRGRVRILGMDAGSRGV